MKKTVSKLKIGDKTNFGIVKEIGKDSIAFKAKDLPVTTIKFNQYKMGSRDLILSKLRKKNEEDESEAESAIAEKYIPSLGFKNADEAINNAYNTFTPTSNLAKSIIKKFGNGYADNFTEIHDHIEKALDIWDNVRSEIMDKD